MLLDSGLQLALWQENKPRCVCVFVCARWLALQGCLVTAVTRWAKTGLYLLIISTINLPLNPVIDYDLNCK